jgi:excinuclease UvrABC nuclease subunit
VTRTRFQVPRSKSGVYLLKKEGKIVYIGSSSNVLCRLAGHKKKAFDSIEIRWMEIDKARSEEHRLIMESKPTLNVRCQGSEAAVTWKVPKRLAARLRTLRSEGFDISKIVAGAVQREMPRVERIRKKFPPVRIPA